MVSLEMRTAVITKVIVPLIALKRVNWVVPRLRGFKRLLLIVFRWKRGNVEGQRTADSMIVFHYFNGTSEALPTNAKFVVQMKMCSLKFIAALDEACAKNHFLKWCFYP